MSDILLVEIEREMRRLIDEIKILKYLSNRGRSVVESVKWVDEKVYCERLAYID